MKTNTKKIHKEPTGAQRLKGLKVASIVCIHFTAIMAALSVAGFWTEEPGDHWLMALQSAMALLFVVLSVIMLHQTTHCQGQYRCKVCGQIHTPGEDSLADHMTYGKIYCTHCGKLTTHEKLRAKECAQLSLQ